MPGRPCWGEFGFSLVQWNGGAWTCYRGSRFSLWELCLMSEPKSKKPAPLHEGFEWAGAVARVRRGGRTGRPGRRTALLSMLTAAYANSSRGTRTTDRTGAER